MSNKTQNWFIKSFQAYTHRNKKRAADNSHKKKRELLKLLRFWYTNNNCSFLYKNKLLLCFVSFLFLLRWNKTWFRVVAIFFLFILIFNIAQDENEASSTQFECFKVQLFVPFWSLNLKFHSMEILRHENKNLLILILHDNLNSLWIILHFQQLFPYNFFFKYRKVHYKCCKERDWFVYKWVLCKNLLFLKKSCIIPNMRYMNECFQKIIFITFEMKEMSQYGI
jgi:hypothetical protein